MSRPPPEILDRAALLARVLKIREHLTVAAFHALTDGREPEELSDDTLRYVIDAVDRALERDER